MLFERAVMKQIRPNVCLRDDAGCERILSGESETGQPYHHFGGECRQHPISDTPGEVIVYSEEKY